MQNVIMEKRTYTVQEVSEMLQVSKASAYSLVKSGVFKTVKVGERILISKRSFDEWLDENL